MPWYCPFLHKKSTLIILEWKLVTCFQALLISSFISKISSERSITLSDHIACIVTCTVGESSYISWIWRHFIEHTWGKTYSFHESAKKRYQFSLQSVISRKSNITRLYGLPNIKWQKIEKIRIMCNLSPLFSFSWAKGMRLVKSTLKNN